MTPDVILNIGLVVVSIVLLWKGSGWLVGSASRIGRKFKMSDLTIGLTICAFGTSAPEFAVTISAAISGKPDISVGNVVGSNIFNLGFILGGCALFRALKATREIVYRDGAILIGTSVLLLFFLHDQYFARYEGIILFAGLFGYLILLFARKKPLESGVPAGTATWKDYPWLLFGVGCVVGGGHLLVYSASEVARFWGVSEWVIAVTIVAAGTSAPELATSLMAAAKGRYGMSLGNLIGSDLFNLLGVLGLAGTIRSMHVADGAVSSIAMLMGMCMIVVIFLRTGWVISRREGAILVLIGIARWIMDFVGR
jgi:cation:H+ antiporter